MKILSDKLDDYIPDQTTGNIQKSTDFDFIHGLVVAISFIVVSEICDKTFFIVTIMAMRHSLLIVYTGAMSALIMMTIISALLGKIVTKFLPTIYTYYLSNILFVCFGIKMLKDGYYMSPNEGTNEYEEVQDEIEKAEARSDLKLEGGSSRTMNNSIKEDQQKNFAIIIRRYTPVVFMQTFIMTFLAVSIKQIYHHYLIVLCRNGEIDLR
jgi:putative Ca2+/H+ antiporter (TMEM165/GDT1 family)